MNPARQEIEDALAALRHVVNAAHRRFGESEVAYELVFLVDDGEALVEVVRRGLLMEKLSQDGVLPWQLLIDRGATSTKVDGEPPEPSVLLERM